MATSVPFMVIGSLSNGVFERRTPTGSGLFHTRAMFFTKMFGQIVCIRVKKHSKTNVVA